MKVEFINPFVAAVVHVLHTETGEPPRKGELRLEDQHYTTSDITVVIGVVGKVSGAVLLGFTQRTDLGVVSAMLGQPVERLDKLAESAIGEIGNMVTGRASGLLERAVIPAPSARPPW